MSDTALVGFFPFAFCGDDPSFTGIELGPALFCLGRDFVGDGESRKEGSGGSRLFLRLVVAVGWGVSNAFATGLLRTGDLILIGSTFDLEADVERRSED